MILETMLHDFTSQVKEKITKEEKELDAPGIVLITDDEENNAMKKIQQVLDYYKNSGKVWTVPLDEEIEKYGR